MAECSSQDRGLTEAFAGLALYMLHASDEGAQAAFTVMGLIADIEAAEFGHAGGRNRFTCNPSRKE